MEHAKRILRELREKSPAATEQSLLNVLREYLQTLALKLIYRSPSGPALSFMGGTALRICHGIKRHSEDLDFALDDPGVPAYDFIRLIGELGREFTLRGFQTETAAHAEKTVQKGMLRFAGLGEAFGLSSWPSGRKLHLKIEVDRRPVKLRKGERESFFVTRFDEIFPILKHGLPTLFAGKVLAILKRPYDRGRDYYDLVWYLSRKIPLNVAYLNRGLGKKTFRDDAAVFAQIGKKIAGLNMNAIMKDMGRFLEDPSEAEWIGRYGEVYGQLISVSSRVH